MTQEIVQSFIKTSFMILWIVGVQAYGFSVVLLLGFLYIIISVWDTFLGWYLARRKLLVKSRIREDWVVKKVNDGLIAWCAAILCRHIAYVSTSDGVDVIASIIAALPILAFMFGQINSLVENSSIITTDPLQQRILWIMRTILGISVDSILDKSKKYFWSDNEEELRLLREALYQMKQNK